MDGYQNKYLKYSGEDDFIELLKRNRIVEILYAEVLLFTGKVYFKVTADPHTLFMSLVFPIGFPSFLFPCNIDI